MSYWDEFGNMWGDVSYLVLVIFGLVVLIAGIGSILWGIVEAIGGYWRWYLPYLLILVGIAILVFGIPFVNYVGGIWGYE